LFSSDNRKQLIVNFSVSDDTKVDNLISFGLIYKSRSSEAAPITVCARTTATFAIMKATDAAPVISDRAKIERELEFIRPSRRLLARNESPRQGS
jgi:hypothetical protein